MKELKFTLDPSGFPMVWIESIKAYMHWLPVAKIQFEHFLCASPDSYFDANWYEEVLSLNGRISPGEIRSDNYWKAFLSGIKPSEAKRFARWCGKDYSLPTLSEWFDAYKALKELPLEPVEIIDRMGELKDRVRTLMQRLDQASGASRRIEHRTLADQMLMRLGVMEWVECTGQRSQWGGMGQTPPAFYGSLFSPDHGQPGIPNNPEDHRLHPYGFRLIRRSA